MLEDKVLFKINSGQILILIIIFISYNIKKEKSTLLELQRILTTISTIFILTKV